jgi:hypothetical protein
MKIIGYDTGRLIALFPVEEIRPHAGLYVPIVQSALIQRYGFLSQPDLSRPIEEIERDGFKFGQGRAIIDGKLIRVGEFAFYNDGVVVHCHRTEDAEMIWNDMLEWSKTAMGFRGFARPPRLLYRSIVIVEFENNLSKLLNGFQELRQIVDDTLKHNTPYEASSDFVSFSIGVDPTKIPGLSPVPFTIDRRAGSPFEDNRYYCQASLPTRVHTTALERIEALVSNL